jgi:hypothetical protein
MSERYEIKDELLDLVQDRNLWLLYPKPRRDHYVLEDADEYLLKHIYYPKEATWEYLKEKRGARQHKVIIDDAFDVLITHWRNSVLI